MSSVSATIWRAVPCRMYTFIITWASAGNCNAGNKILHQARWYRTTDLSPLQPQLLALLLPPEGCDPREIDPGPPVCSAQGWLCRWGQGFVTLQKSIRCLLYLQLRAGSVAGARGLTLEKSIRCLLYFEPRAHSSPVLSVTECLPQTQWRSDKVWRSATSYCTEERDWTLP